jgi:hypothetical protein
MPLHPEGGNIEDGPHESSKAEEEVREEGLQLVRLGPSNQQAR